jgi:diguanylate cyclase (GGDEF)-like protein
MVVLSWVLYIYASYYLVSVFIQQSALSPVLMLICFILYILSLKLSTNGSIAPWLRLFLVCCMHTVGQLSSVLPIYVLTMIKDTHTVDDRDKAWWITGAYMAALTGMSLLQSGLNQPLIDWLHLAINNFHFLTSLWVTRYFLALVKQTEKLKIQQKIMSVQDTLTGLYNYEECHRRLETLIAHKVPVMLILIDCQDLKSMNTTKGFHAGNLILKQVSELLKILFSEALFISRYGGDEFAVITPLHNPDARAIKHILDSELPRLTSIQITYGMASYEHSTMCKDDLILTAENNLFLKKRETWLKREEHMLRSEKLRVVGELASGMAHEIRNPLTTVKGFLQISKSNDYNIKTWYPLIMDEINRMSDLTAEFLQFSKPRETQFQIHTLHECILKVISLTNSEATRLGHQIRYDLPAEPFNIFMDQDKMIQLLLNLVKNAYEAMQENGFIFLSLARSNDHVVLEVQDTGQGISAEHLDKIFHPFYTTKVSGTGLGLSICHKIVQDHQGTLEVESIINQGTRFIITFPLTLEEEVTLYDHAAYI